MKPETQIKRIEKNIKNVHCPILLFEMNKKYRELLNKIDYIESRL